jgi:hypothetical protein
VKELKSNPIKIRATNLNELERLCDEFGFDESSGKLSRFSKRFDFPNFSDGRQFASAFTGMQNAFLKESIEVIVNGIVIELEIGEVAALVGSVQEQFSGDRCR